jgi:hypothetical protein
LGPAISLERKLLCAGLVLVIAIRRRNAHAINNGTKVALSWISFDTDCFEPGGADFIVILEST